MTGESSGRRRNVGSPDIFVEDFSAAVDFLGKQRFVDREKIGILGICGLGSHALTAASIAVRIKAVATSVMYNMSDSMWKGLNNTKTEEEREKEKDYLAQIRWEEVDSGKQIGGCHELPFDENGNPVRASKLIVTGTAAHSRYMAEEAYERLTEPKELVEVPHAIHTDLYDQMDKIPFDKFDSFFKENLR